MVELLAVIVILGILMTIGFAAYTRYRQKARQQAYDTMAKSATEAAEEYLMDNPKATVVTFDELVEGEYLDTIQDPRNNSKDCSGKVVITKNESNDKKVLDVNTYKVSMCCKKYNYTYSYPDGVISEDDECKSQIYDINDIKEIKVLNVYPNSSYASYLQSWMNTYGQYNGEQIIKVTPVSIESFNADPEGILGKKGNWNYNTIVFGFADCNSSKDLNEKAASVTNDFLVTRHSAIFGHDTITTGCGNHKNFISLAKYVGIETRKAEVTYSTQKVEIIKKGIFTEYPHKIGNVNTVLSIPTTHVYGQIAKGDVWLTLSGGTNSDPIQSVYLSTYGNNAFIQTGHSNGQATPDEQKIIANIIFYSKAKQLDL